MTEPKTLTLDASNPADAARAFVALQNRISALERSGRAGRDLLTITLATFGNAGTEPLVTRRDIDGILQILLLAAESHPPLAASPDVAQFAQRLIDAWSGKILEPLPRARDHLRVVRTDGLTPSS